MEVEQQINKKIIKAEEGEKSKHLMTDAEIRTANNLYKRRENQEKLTAEETTQLEILTIKRESESNSFFPKFNFKKIIGFKGDKTELTEDERKESGRQYELAKKFFTELTTLSPSELSNRALYRKKLENWNDDPEQVENIFRHTYDEKQKELRELNEDVEAAYRTEGLVSEKCNEFIKKSESNEISLPYIESFSDIIKDQRLIIQYLVPDYFREAVLYVPGLAKEASRRLKHNYFLKGRDKSRLEEKINLFQVRIDKVENFTRIKGLRTVPA